MEVSGRKVLQLFCEQCDDNGQKLLAAGFCVDCSEFLCRDCYKHHSRAKAYRKHVLQDGNSMPKTKPGSTQLKLADNENKCSKHKGETIKFYCCSHSTFGCGSCIALDHHGCDKPIYIQEEYEKFGTKIDYLNEQLECHSNKKDQNSTAIKSQHSKVFQDIKFFMTKVKQYFENLENSMITETDKIKSADEQNMNAISSSCMTLKTELQSLTSDISKLQQTEQNEKLFTRMKDTGDQIKNIELNIDQMNAANKVQLYSFVPESQIKDMMKTLTILGKLSIEKETNQTDVLKTSEEDIKKEDAEVNQIQPTRKPRRILPAKIETQAPVIPRQFPFKLIQASNWAEFNIHSTTDKHICHVTGFALLPDDHVILTDNANNKIKLFNVTQDKLISELNLSSRPHDITAINDNHVAVTIPDANHIQMLSILNQTISLGQTIKVKGQCHGIVYNEGTLIVTFVEPAKVEIISMSGTVLKVIDKGTNSEPLFQQPKYITLSFDKTHVYISDNGKHYVTCLTLDGGMKGIYKDKGLSYPCGLTVDKTGSVYVVGGGYYSGYIYKISADCSQGHCLLGEKQGLGSPQSIAYCNKEDKLYVGQNDKTIAMFQLK